MSILVLPLLLPLLAAETSSLEAKALEKINTYRQLAGLAPVTMDPVLSRGCAAHAQYLLTHFDAAWKGQVNVHDEEPQREGYTPEGRKASRSSEIARGVGNNDPLAGIDLWMASFLHRIKMLDPALEKVGIGSASRAGREWTLVIDVVNGRVKPRPTNSDGYRAICYPSRDQKDVPLAYNFGHPEVPNPIPDNGESKDAGHPITVTFFGPQFRLPIRNATGTLTDEAGHELAVWLSSPEKPAIRGFEFNTICLIPQAPLQPNTTYTVKVSALVNNRPWSSTWSFRSGGEK